MSRERKGLLIAVLHVLIVCSLGGKLLIDRHRYPRVWVKTTSYDPEHIVRGRYVSLALELPWASNFELSAEEQQQAAEWKRQYPKMPAHNIRRPAHLEVREGKLVAVAIAREDSSEWGWVTINPDDPAKVIWGEPVQYYIPEHSEDPSRQPRGSELWAEVTIPKKGPPRPIQLATSGPGGWHVLNLH